VLVDVDPMRFLVAVLCARADLARVCRIEDRSLEVVEEIKVKGSPNGPSLGALHVAALNGKLEMCEFLIDELNLDVNAAAQHGN
jgi:hypothetical protein